MGQESPTTTISSLHKIPPISSPDGRLDPSRNGPLGTGPVSLEDCVKQIYDGAYAAVDARRLAAHQGDKQEYAKSERARKARDHGIVYNQLRFSICNKLRHNHCETYEYLRQVRTEVLTTTTGSIHEIIHTYTEPKQAGQDEERYVWLR